MKSINAVVCLAAMSMFRLLRADFRQLKPGHDEGSITVTMSA